MLNVDKRRIQHPMAPRKLAPGGIASAGLIDGFTVAGGFPVRHAGGTVVVAGASAIATPKGRMLKMSGSSSGIRIPSVGLDGSKQIQITALVWITSQASEMIFEQSATADSNAGIYFYGVSSSNVLFQVNTGGALQYDYSVYTLPSRPCVLTIRADISANPTKYEIWEDGIAVRRATIAVAAGSFATNDLNVGCRNGSSLSSDGAYGDVFVHNAWTPDAELAEWHRNLWAIYKRRIWVPVSAGGGVTHQATGALSAQSATLAGSAVDVRTFTSAGAMTAQAATLAGIAAHLTLHTSIGAISAQAATLSGAANHVTIHASSGALNAQAATLSGSANLSVGGAFTAVGALTSQSATVAGTAAHYTLHAATGDLDAQAATLAGVATHLTLHTSTGVLVADPASVSGVAVHSGDGAEVVQPRTGAGKSRRQSQRVVVEIDGEDFIAESSEEAQAILDQAKEAAEEKAKVAIERATKARNRPTRKVMADARKALELPAISAPDLGGYAEEISRQIEDIYQSAIQTIEVAALLRKRELEEEDDEDILMLL